jgi:DNA-binding transcriptional ArsR family regulator
LSQVRFELLMLLRHHPEEQLTLGQLARGLDLSPRTVTSLADVLERDGLIRRLPHATDRRAVLARITPEGISALRRPLGGGLRTPFPDVRGLQRGRDGPAPPPLLQAPGEPLGRSRLASRPSTAAAWPCRTRSRPGCTRPGARVTRRRRAPC